MTFHLHSHHVKDAGCYAKHETRTINQIQRACKRYRTGLYYLALDLKLQCLAKVRMVEHGGSHVARGIVSLLA